jgi:hypothetical protein
MSKKPETLILRFRDLATPQGGTIADHQAEITDHKYVWWGWWNKAGEKVPSQTFADIHEIAIQAGLDLILFDSGTSKVYRARCVDLHWDKSFQLCATPEPTATPQYYRVTEYLAWFKLTSIAECSADELRNWTYLQIDEFFAGPKSRFGPFYGKRIYSTEELRQQDRTIWFVRKFREGDSTHEISLLDAFKFSPADFPSSFRITHHKNVLWLSDLHFSVDEGHHGFPLISSAAEHALWHVIEATLKQEGLEKLGGVLLSGDFTWKADQAEFDQVRSFLTELRSKLALESYDYLICPGNHDIPFSTEPWNDDQPVSVAPATASSKFRSFYNDLFYLNPNKFLASGRRLILGGCLPVEIAALNSQMLDQKDGMFQGHGFVGQDQLDFVEEEMGWNREQDGGLPVRIVMLHHHLLPVTYREIPKAGANYSLALDAEAVLRWIVRNKVKLALHGHQHQPYCTKICRKLTPDAEGGEHEFWVLGMGSCGVAANHLGEIAKNTMGVLTFSSDSLTIKVFTIHKTNSADLAWEVRIPLREGASCYS